MSEAQMDLTPNQFSWNELCTSDVEAAKTFYSKVFGWSFAAAPAPNDDYQMASTGDIPVAGIMNMPPNAPMGMPPSWGAYITVENCDATVDATQAAGGSVIVPATDVPNVGRFAMLADPQGAIFGIMEYHVSGDC